MTLYVVSNEISYILTTVKLPLCIIALYDSKIELFMSQIILEMYVLKNTELIHVPGQLQFIWAQVMNVNTKEWAERQID